MVLQRLGIALSGRIEFGDIESDYDSINHRRFAVVKGVAAACAVIIYSKLLQDPISPPERTS